MVTRRSILGLLGVAGAGTTVVAIASNQSSNKSRPNDTQTTPADQAQTNKDQEGKEEMSENNVPNDNQEKSDETAESEDPQDNEQSETDSSRMAKIVFTTDISEIKLGLDRGVNETTPPNPTLSNEEPIELVETYADSGDINNYNIDTINITNTQITAEGTPKGIFNLLTDESEIDGIKSAGNEINIEERDPNDRVEMNVTIVLDKENQSYGIQSEMDKAIQSLEKGEATPDETNQKIQTLRKEFSEKAKQDIRDSEIDTPEPLVIEEYSISGNPEIRLTATQINILNILDLDVVKSVKSVSNNS